MGLNPSLGRGTTAAAVLPSRRALPSWPLDRISAVVLLAMGAVFGIAWAASGIRPIDADVYWQSDLSHLYGAAWVPGSELVYLYPPPLAQLMVPLHLLGWPLFIAVWTFALFAATAYAGRRWALALVAIGIVLYPFVGFDHPLRHPLLYPLLGNIQPLLVAAVVLSFRFPALWSVVILTKITPGVGVLWFAFRREWRSFAMALGATAIIAAISFVLAPGLWLQFASFALDNQAATAPGAIVTIPLWVRLPMSVALIWWGARTDRRWVVPIAAGWALIALFEWSFVEFWMAAPVLWLADRERRRAAVDPVSAPRAQSAS